MDRPDLAALDAAATSGVWGQFNATIGPFKAEALAHYRAHGWGNTQDTSHHMSTLDSEGKPYRVGEFRHANDAAFAEALVNEYRAGRLVPAPETEKV